MKRKETFNSPKDFLEELQVLFQKAPSAELESDLGFHILNKQEFEQLKGYSLEELLDGTSLIKYLLKFLEDSMTDLEWRNINEKIAFGQTFNMACNALCVKSPDNKFAILIFEGLFQLIHKHGKLVLAEIDPSQVKYCNRGDHNKLKPKDYIKFRKELINNYIEHSAPIGPLLKLSTEYSQKHQMSIILQELFVICHELGHFFNGDLSDENNFRKIRSSDLSTFINNKDHVIEFEADLTGFNIFEKAVKTRYPNLNTKQLILIISSLFDLFALTNPNESKTHPPPLARIVYLIIRKLGTKHAEIYLKTFLNKSGLKSFLED